MYKKIFFPALLLVCTSTSGQSYFYDNRYYDSPLLLEAGISIGAMNCLTDLGGRSGKGKDFIKDLNWDKTHGCGGLHVSVLYQYAIGARLEFNFGNVSAADSVLKGDNSIARGRYNRNLDFSSRIKELSLLIELHPMALTGACTTQFSPYVLAGVGLFAFDPQTIYHGQRVSLRSLRTEGQAFREYPNVRPYGKTQLNFSAGAGIRYELSALLCLRLELVHRFLQTDYLDDVSGQYIDARFFSLYHDAVKERLAKALADRRRSNAPPGTMRGNPRNNDTYFSFQAKAAVALSRHRL